MNIDQVFESLLTQSPIAGVCAIAARYYMKKHSDIVQQLVSSFEASNKGCEERYQQVFSELMKIKESIK